MAPETNVFVSADAIVTSSFHAVGSKSPFLSDGYRITCILLSLLQTVQPETGSNTIKDLERLHPLCLTCKELLMITVSMHSVPVPYNRLRKTDHSQPASSGRLPVYS